LNEYLNGIRSGNLMILSRAITLIESKKAEHQERARELIERCLPFSGKSIRIGITGVPGVGKSTFINSLGKYLTAQNHKLAVLAIDPSSTKTGGSILGDKTRMDELSTDRLAFIRPSPSSGSLGGVAKSTRESIILCEAAGFEIIFVETVGVGQSETIVHSMTDFFLLLMLSGAGDELQGIKRGIMELADAIVINKADGDNLTKAKAARAEYAGALHLFPPADSGWIPRSEICSATANFNIEKIWEIILSYKELTTSNNYFDTQRRQQAKHWFHQSLSDDLRVFLYTHPKTKNRIEKLENQVISNQTSPFFAAQELISMIKL
jgi:LAO/AO transport system kinase